MHLLVQPKINPTKQSPTTFKDINFLKAVNDTFMLWGKYGFDSLDRAVQESGKKYNIDESRLMKELSLIEKEIQTYN